MRRPPSVVSISSMRPGVLSVPRRKSMVVAPDLVKSASWLLCWQCFRRTQTRSSGPGRYVPARLQVEGSDLDIVCA